MSDDLPVRPQAAALARASGRKATPLDSISHFSAACPSRSRSKPLHFTRFTPSSSLAILLQNPTIRAQSTINIR